MVTFLTPGWAVLGKTLAAGDAPNPLLPKIPEIVVGLIAFSLLFYMLKTKVFPIFEKVYADRTAAIEGGIAKAEAAQAEAAAALNAYQAQLAEARGEAARIREEARSEALAIGEELRTQARTEAADILTRAQAQIEAERAATISALRREVGTLAVDLAGRIVGQALEDDARQRLLVDAFITGLERQEV